jgi:hypothetical protein
MHYAHLAQDGNARQVFPNEKLLSEQKKLTRLAICTVKPDRLKIAQRDLNLFDRCQAFHFKAPLNRGKLISEDCAF